MVDEEEKAAWSLVAAGRSASRSFNVVQDWLVKLMQRMWREEDVPEVGEMISLHKKGDRLECDKCRCICILLVGYIILGRCIGNLWHAFMKRMYESI